LKPNNVLHSMTGALLFCSLSAGAQTQSTTEPATASAQTPEPAATATSTSTWRSIDLGAYFDGYYSYNNNHPSNEANGQANDLYNFNDKANQFNLSLAKLTINHDPNPIGVHADVIFGRTNVLLQNANDKDTAKYLKQAYISAKVNKVHGAEFDFGQFVTSAGAEVIEAKDDWSYSRSLLFSWAIPYYHFGLRSSLPVTKTWTAGLQVVHGWNNIVDNTGGVTIGLTSSLAPTPEYSWSLNIYTGPENSDTQQVYRNLVDTTLTLTPTPKLNAYINYDYAQNHASALGEGDDATAGESSHWQGVAFAAREQVTAKSALAGRFEYFDDNQGYSTGSAQALKEFTATYEYKWLSGLLTRAEYRRDCSNKGFFNKGNNELAGTQSTLTVAVIAFFGLKR
jgi:Putative beta-barrel porin-2, OmpL-like. bbp2